MPSVDLEFALTCQSSPLWDTSDALSPGSSVDEGNGYADGYKLGLQNLLSSLVPLAEQHLATLNAESPATRRHVYAFIEYLERHIERARMDVGYVCDGLWI